VPRMRVTTTYGYLLFEECPLPLDFALPKHNKRCVILCGIAIYITKYLHAKEELWKHHNCHKLFESQEKTPKIDLDYQKKEKTFNCLSHLKVIRKNTYPNKNRYCSTQMDSAPRR
jgi:hypothetical protein